MDYILIALGLVGLFFGGEFLVRGSVGAARALSISPLVIGLTIVGFGTSTPELLVSVQAALRGAPDLAVGNIVGSNIANTLLIIGVTALICPIVMGWASVRRDAFVMVACALALVPLFAMGVISRGAGVMLLTGLAAYLVWTFISTRGTAQDADIPQAPMSVAVSLVWIVGGFVALLAGSRCLVDGSIAVARGLGLSEAFIGLTIVAVGTSLPELATSVIAALRRQSDIAIGNVVGSNIFNVMGILGVTAAIRPIPVAPRFSTFDLPIMMAAALALSGILLIRSRIGRWAGAVALVAYAVYVVAAR